MTGPGPVVRAMRPDDWDAVRAIYLEGIESGNATFETEAPNREAWDAARRADCRLVAEREGRVVGFAVLSPTSSRPVYRGVCEVMVYVGAAARGLGIGAALMRTLVAESERAGVWTLQAGVFPENTASIRVHEGVGFREVGRRRAVGQFHDGRWRDVVLLERRSEVVGAG
ncbi:MAG: N-acetyltransferase family protein [Gemmatimonadota bacterium]